MQDSQKKPDTGVSLRIPDYVSPSALKCFEKSREEYFVRYLCFEKPPRPPQTEPMSVGSAFDAFVKSYIHQALFGHYGKNNEYEPDTIFENQVEEHVRDFAYEAGQYVLKAYSKSGALADMMFELNKSAGDPRFEFEIKGMVSTNVGDIPLLGRPDIFFINSEGARVIWDWKVNGFCGNSATSPNKGYTICRDAWDSGKKHSRNNHQPHKDCVLKEVLGIKINGVSWMEDLNTDWADQLTIYGWLLGEEVGSEQMIIGIDQIVSCGLLEAKPPFLRVASFRNRVSENYQFTLQSRLEYLWNCIQTRHIFQELSFEENIVKCQQLMEEAKMFSGDDPITNFINAHCRS